MFRFVLTACLLARFAVLAEAQDDSGVYVRFQLLEPVNTSWHVRLGGYVHIPNWYIPKATIPAGADKDETLRLRSGAFTNWFDLKSHAGKLLHGRLMRAGGVAEFPNVTVQFLTSEPAARRRIVIELADQPDVACVVKRFEESFAGDLTSFLVSPELQKDADSLETAAQMTARRLAWAEDATGGRRRSPQHHIIQTSFWSPQRPELNLQEAQVLHLLGFNVVGNQQAEVQEAFPGLRVPGHTHRVAFGPASTRQDIDELITEHAEKEKIRLKPGAPYGFADEICARPRIGDNHQARAHLHAWLQANGIAAHDLGVQELTDVVPLETPEDYRQAAIVDAAAAARVFYYTSRFRQEAGTQRIRWHTESFHKYFPDGPVTTTLVADHPYFGGTGLGMGMVPNSTWGGAPLALDWFDMARRTAVDLFGIEDWMGLQFMYGPNSTWEGFQLMGFQAAMFRSGGRNQDVPIIAWITPSDETNLRLKSHSALCQGAKHFFYWTYGPTATSTENYWSDLRSSYDGIVRVSSQLAAAEDVLFPARLRSTRVALLYSISSDLWQPYGYRSMLERRGIYLSLVHDQFLVDMLTEQDIEAGRLEDYKVLYATGPNITSQATERIINWVRDGGHLFASGNAGTRNEFNEPVTGLSVALGVKAGAEATVQEGVYRVRAQLNAIPHLNRITFQGEPATNLGPGFGVIGIKIDVQPVGGKVIGRFDEGAPAVVIHHFGEGRSTCVATTPGISYIKDAKFVASDLKEQWPTEHRQFINSAARAAGVLPQVELSHPVVEAGVFEGPEGVALVLANFTYEKIEKLTVRLPVRAPVSRIHAADDPETPIPFWSSPSTRQQQDGGFTGTVRFEIPLGLDQIVLLQ